MHRLTFIEEREQGAIATIVAMLFGFGVMLALGALTVDVGNINADRRQLQNGADAVALAVAQKCASTGTCAAYDASGVVDTSLQALVDANAADRKTAIRRVDGAVGTPLAGKPAICGTATGLEPCPASWTPTTWVAGAQNLQECPPVTLPSTADKYVRVYTETKNGAGDYLLPYYFGAAITGISGANQQACATVGYGNGKLTGPILPITMSYCQWKTATGADPRHDPPVAGTYVSPPDYTFGVPYGYDAIASTSTPPWPTAPEKEIYTSGSTAVSPGCTTWNGNAAPGNFGALVQTPSNSCVTRAAEWISGGQGGTGNDAPCTDAQLVGYLGKVVAVPLYDCVSSSTAPITTATNCQDSGNANYHITGYASFYLTGWQFSSSSNTYGYSISPNNISTNGQPKKLCWGPGTTGNSGRCLSGWFTRSIVQAGDLDKDSAPDFGTKVIQMLG